MKRRAGSSFVEVLVATAIMVAVLLPVLFILTQSMRTSEVSLDELEATNLASEIMEQMKIMPFTVGFGQMVQTPVPNPAPRFPDWEQLPPGGIAFPEADPNVSARLPGLDSKGWTKFGCNYWLDPTLDNAIVSRARLYLSELPADRRRWLKIHHPIADPTGALDPNLWQVMARVEWDRTFLGAPTQTRSTQMGTLLAFPSVN